MGFTIRIPALISLRVIVLFHAFLSIWAVLNAYLGSAYLFANFGLSMIGVWALGDQTSLEAISLYLIVLVFTILNDCITLGVYTKEHVAYGDNAASETKFSFAMALINLIFKPISFILILQEYNRRGGAAKLPGVTITSSASYEPIASSTQPDPAQDPSAYSSGAPAAAKYDSV